jgi:hypothetical protein
MKNGAEVEDRIASLARQIARKEGQIKEETDAERWLRELPALLEDLRKLKAEKSALHWVMNQG